MATLRQFARRMRQIGVRVEHNVDVMGRRVGLAVHQAVVSGTPVDEGVARSNWIPNIGIAVTRVRPAFTPGSKGSTGAANTAAALSEGQSVIRRFGSEQELHITNNLPYIVPLNEGSSAQAPAGFVQDGVMAGVEVATSTPLTGRRLND